MYLNNLGPIKEGNIHFNDLVVIWGKNNSGKTMLTYLLYSIREEFIKFSFDFSLIKENGELYKRINKGESVKISRTEMRSLYKQFQEYFEENSAKILSTYYEVDINQFKNFKIRFEEDEIYNLFPLKQKKSRGRVNQRVNGETIVSTLFFVVEEDYIEFGLYKYDIEREQFSDDVELESQKQIELQFSKDRFNDYFSGFIKFMSNMSRSIYFPAERIGINQFRRELKTERANLSFYYDEQKNQNKYPIPLEDYIRFIFSIQNQKINKRHSYLGAVHSLNNGEFIYDEISDEFLFTNDSNDESVPFNMISSSLKSLLGFTEYLKRSRMLRSSMLFIDEPEMNLHPEKQVELMELMEKIILEENTKIILSTHSNFITRKLLNILLSSYIHNGETNLNRDNVNIYEINNGKIGKFDAIEEHSFIKNFDDVLDDLDSEYFSLINKMEREEL